MGTNRPVIRRQMVVAAGPSSGRPPDELLGRHRPTPSARRDRSADSSQDLAPGAVRRRAGGWSAALNPREGQI